MPKIPRKKLKTPKKDPNGLTAIGVTCGIGSMLVGARAVGFEVQGNIEWRGYYHRKDRNGNDTFQMNFPETVFCQNLDQLSNEQIGRLTGVDLAMGHPECGAWSQMQGCNNFREQETRKTSPKNPCDIPLFTGIIGRLRPRFFVMDDLPKSLGAYSMEDYAKALPDYDLFPEWISNYHYGNIQKQRKRMFIIGSLKEEAWAFQPGEIDHNHVLKEVLTGLRVLPIAGEVPNHDPHDLDSECGRGLHMDYPWHRPTWKDMRDWFKGKKEGTSFRYYSPHAPEGETKVKPGWYKQYWEGTCAVLDGGSGHMHPKRNLPFTIRERARIQGFPDDFIFYGVRLDGEGKWIHERNIDILKQTGKAMPIQFNRYVANQVAAKIKGEEFKSSGDRLIKPNEYVDRAKLWFCQNSGYSNQEAVCQNCWLCSSCPVRPLVLPVALVEGDEDSLKYYKESPYKKRPKKTTSKRGTKRGTKKTRRKAKTLVDMAEVPIKRVAIPAGERVEYTPSRVNTIRGKLPDDYYCKCKFCQKVIGELRQKDGAYYSRQERQKYYNPIEKGKYGHVAKTPIHIARWAVQRFTEVGDWVLDPTVGAGTTMVEALIQQRKAVGIELQFKEILLKNVSQFAGNKEAIVGVGDARLANKFLEGLGKKFSLIVNNPPYSGDEHWTTFNVPEDHPENTWSTTMKAYNRILPNLAFLKEGEEYWRTFLEIYGVCAKFLRPGGRFVIGVKDQMRQKKPDQLHMKFAEILASIPSLQFEGVAVLNHYPRTLHLNSYPKLYGVDPPYYQSIIVFKRRGK